jgi:hypothetical protein
VAGSSETTSFFKKMKWPKRSDKDNMKAMAHNGYSIDNARKKRSVQNALGRYSRSHHRPNQLLNIPEVPQVTSTPVVQERNRKEEKDRTKRIQPDKQSREKRETRSEN